MGVGEEKEKQIEGRMYCARPGPGDAPPVAFGPPHIDMTQARIWAESRESGVKQDEPILFLRVHRVGTARVRRLQIEFDENDQTVALEPTPRGGAEPPHDTET